MVEKKKVLKGKSKNSKKTNKGRKIAIAKKSTKNLKRRKSDKKNPDIINLVDDVESIIIYDPEVESIEIKDEPETVDPLVVHKKKKRKWPMWVAIGLLVLTGALILWNHLNAII